MDRRDAGKAGKAEIPAAAFRRLLMCWYAANARRLPWRETGDPYRIWVSEIMLQQTRVGAVVEHYNRFIAQFPTVLALSLAPEEEVLAAWSGLGYYRRARMLHKAARFLVLERAGVLPGTAADLRTLPGIGEYTGAAIASIAFGERVAVVDGNVERVILRLTGRGEEADSPIRGAAMRAFIRQQAQALVPVRHTLEAVLRRPASAVRGGTWGTEERIALAAAAHPGLAPDETRFVAGIVAESGTEARRPASNEAGDHNQAMMELGATICLPRAPLCHACPVAALCRTRGEHRTAERPKQVSRPAAYLLQLRNRGTAAEILLERRPEGVSLMPGMYELPPLPVEAVEGWEPVLRVRHAITNTNYYVQVYAGKTGLPGSSKLRSALKAEGRDLHWVKTSRVGTMALTGLARKVLHRLKLIEGPAIELLR